MHLQTFENLSLNDINAIAAKLKTCTFVVKLVAEKDSLKVYSDGHLDEICEIVKTIKPLN